MKCCKLEAWRLILAVPPSHEIESMLVASRPGAMLGQSLTEHVRQLGWFRFAWLVV